MKPNSGKGGNMGLQSWKRGQTAEDPGVIMRGFLWIRKQ